MSENPIPDAIQTFARDLGPERDDVLREMDERADREGFPTVGPAVGGWLATLAQLVDAERIFEFGSGFGYSAYWFARALPESGEVVLTEIDEDELDDARAYFERGGFADRARFVHGDAIETARTLSDPVDVVLVDNEKERYVEAYETIRETVRPGGLVLADNAVAGPIDFEDVRALLAGDETVDASPASRGIVDYLQHVREDDGFETVVLPLGEGVALSRKLS